MVVERSIIELQQIDIFFFIACFKHEKETQSQIFI
jgi:hypothetical protein